MCGRRIIQGICIRISHALNIDTSILVFSRKIVNRRLLRLSAFRTAAAAIIGNGIIEVADKIGIRLVVAGNIFSGPQSCNCECDYNRSRSSSSALLKIHNQAVFRASGDGSRNRWIRVLFHFNRLKTVGPSRDMRAPIFAERNVGGSGMLVIQNNRSISILRNPTVHRVVKVGVGIELAVRRLNHIIRFNRRILCRPSVCGRHTQAHGQSH